MKLFIGTNFGHGSSLAAISDSGELIYAVEEGCLIGRKDTSRFPSTALDHLLNTFTPEIVGWGEGWNLLQRLIHKGIKPSLKYGLIDSSYIKSRLFHEFIRFKTGYIAYRNNAKNLNLNKIRFVNHHLAHAYSLIPWGLSSHSLVYVSDTTGELNSISSYYWDGKEMIPITSTPFPHSIGSAFHQFAYHLGFSGRTGPGKLMALSAYGVPIWIDELNKIYNITEKGLRFNTALFPIWHRKKAWRLFAEKQENEALKKDILKSSNNYEDGLNMAASIQSWFTMATWQCIKHAINIAREKHNLTVNHLGLAGGAALNCKSNGFFVRNARKLDIDNIFISPWSDDAGTAIGAAAKIYHEDKDTSLMHSTNMFLGPFANQKHLETSDNNKAIKRAAKILSEGEVVAMVSGRLEFGPRALGGRCLLGDPRNMATKNLLNKMKSRPYFMPIAPVVLESEYNKFFSGIGSVHMAWTVLANNYAKKTIPAAIHINNEARVQVLHNNGPQLLLRLLGEFKKITGVGVLLLTSLNGAGEAIPASLSSGNAIARKLGASGLITDRGFEKFI